MWRELYPELFDGSDNDDDGIDFIGIGTILDRQLPQRGLNVVLGSGTGYAPPPTQAPPKGMVPPVSE